MFSSMKESGCFPDVLTYTAMIKAYSDDGKILLWLENVSIILSFQLILCLYGS